MQRERRGTLGNPLGLSEDAKVAFIQHWFKLGSDALEARLARDPETGSFAHGEAPGLADVVLTSHVLGARMFKTDLSAAPKLGALALAIRILVEGLPAVGDLWQVMLVCLDRPTVLQTQPPLRLRSYWPQR